MRPCPANPHLGQPPVCFPPIHLRQPWKVGIGIGWKVVICSSQVDDTDEQRTDIDAQRACDLQGKDENVPKDSCARSTVLHQPLIPRRKKPGCRAGFLFNLVGTSCRFGRRACYRTLRFLLFDFPRRVMRDIHREVAAGTSQCRHAYASKWLTAGDPFVLTGTARDDMGATIHLWLRLV